MKSVLSLGFIFSLLPKFDHVFQAALLLRNTVGQDLDFAAQHALELAL
jgi:hypothetical protein